MKMRSRWIVVALALGLLLPAGLPSVAQVAPGGTFVDDDGLLHEPDIEAIAAEGITHGCSATQFCPGQAVTRGQMAAFLTRGLGLPASSSSPFTDSAGQFQDDINRLAASGITTGCGGGRFCPTDVVSRGQMAAFLTRGLGLPASSSSPFTDSAGQFQDEIDRLAAAGITTGCGDGRFCPNDPVTRAQMATFLTRGLGLTPIVPPLRPQPLPGNPNGNAPIPAEAAAEDTSNPTSVIGMGTPASCTSQAVVQAVAAGGIVTFNCGPDPVTIVMAETAKVFNNTGPEIVIDGGGLVTLSGGGVLRILYMNTCDPAQEWTTSHCNNQDHPRLTVQNLRFVDGNSTGEDYDGGGGGAIFVRGGSFKIVNSVFSNNRCDNVGPDVGGAAVRVLSQYSGQPVFVVNSTFTANVCSNGGGTSSIGVSWTIINSLFTNNEAIGIGANPQRSGTPGGGNGGAIYLDGNQMTLNVIDTLIENNHAREGGGAIFFVSNNRTGRLVITDSVLRNNPSDGFETNGYPGIFVLAVGPPQVTNSTIE